jgi:hypothetical protein
MHNEVLREGAGKNTQNRQKLHLQSTFNMVDLLITKWLPPETTEIPLHW